MDDGTDRDSSARLRGVGELLDHRSDRAEVRFVEPADEERVDAPALADPAQLRDQVVDRADERVGRLEDLLGQDLDTAVPAEAVGDVAGDLQRVVGDREVAEQAQDADVELGEPIACLLADPADPEVRPRLERIEDRVAMLAQVEPDDVGLPGGEPDDALARAADQEGRVRRLEGLGLPVEVRDRIERPA